MIGNTFGRLFRITTCGESYGKGKGSGLAVIVDGVPPGLKITREDIQKELDQFSITRLPTKESTSLKALLQEYEANLIRGALAKYNGNKSQAARMLNISERNIRFRMEKLNIKKPA